ncbi:MAG: glucoamylase family protein [Saprospiraceae bacterium]
MGDKLFGDYGFYDAYCERADWFPPLLGHRPGTIVVMMENHKSGLLWKLFMSCEKYRRGWISWDLNMVVKNDPADLLKYLF